MAIEKLNTRLKYKTWTNLQINIHNKSHEPWLTRPETQHKKPDHMYINT